SFYSMEYERRGRRAASSPLLPSGTPLLLLLGTLLFRVTEFFLILIAATFNRRVVNHLHLPCHLLTPLSLSFDMRNEFARLRYLVVEQFSHYRFLHCIKHLLEELEAFTLILV